MVLGECTLAWTIWSALGKKLEELVGWTFVRGESCTENQE